MKTIFLILIFVLFTSCRGQKIESTWVDNQIKIDGAIDDWKDIPRTFEKDLKMMFSVANNDENLYIMYCFNDPGLARMIDMRGITVWLNDEGNKDKIFGISFKREFDGSPESLKKRIDGDSEQRPDFKRPMKNDLSMLRFMVQLKDSLVDMPIEIVAGNEACYKVVEGLYGFELKVAVSEISNLPDGMKISDDGQLSVGIEIPEHKMHRDTNKRHEPGMPGGGMQGGRGGGMGGDRGGPPPGFDRQRQDMGAKEVWATVTLAEKTNEN